ncbi:substrate-binding domain-containing protein [Pseudahrensia aquimaris]|uniref:Substrate-binding domain-containing protein n=1 Tax=Pseudahrensia aquimaris TaxID=744461 RepID=A0ABW3FC48_9HYPH
MPKHVRSRKGAPGIVEVAARAGVSPATVSRFFNTPDMVKLPTRTRIERAANDLGYIRDRMAGSMHNRFSGTIGIIVPTIDNAIFSELIESFASRLLVHDRTMLIAAHGYELEREVAIVRSLLERRIDGIALIGFDHDPIALNMLAQRNVPVVSIWNFSETSDLPCIGANNFKAGQMAVEHLLELGHTKISFIFADTKGNDRARARLDGAIGKAKEGGIQVSADAIHTCSYDVGEAKRLVVNILKSEPKTAIVCGNDIISHGAMFACQALHLKVPDAVSIIGIGDFQGSAHMEPGLTTIRLPAKKIGALAADTLVEMNETGRPNPEFRREVELNFIRRGSTAAPCDE